MIISIHSFKCCIKTCAVVAREAVEAWTHKTIILFGLRKYFVYKRPVCLSILSMQILSLGILWNWLGFRSLTTDLHSAVLLGGGGGGGGKDGVKS